MGITVAKLTKSNFKIKGEIDERMPAVTSGLVSFYPLDSAAGTFDKIGGYQPTQHTCSGANLIEAMKLNWRDPNNWRREAGNGNIVWDETKQALKFTGIFIGYFNTPIQLDYTKHYSIKVTYMQESQDSTNYLYIGGYSALANGNSFNGNAWDYSLVDSSKPSLGTWFTVSTNRYGTGAYPSGWTGSQGLAVRYSFGGLFNYNCQNGTDVVYIKDISIVVTDADTSNCAYSEFGTSVDIGTTNLWTATTPYIYNNYSVPASLTTLPNETFLGRPIWRESMTPTEATLVNFQTALSSHGIYGNYRTYLANTAYAVSIFWRCVNKPDIQVGLTASNINGWYDLGTYDIGNGWKRSVAYRDGTVTTDKTDNVFFSFRCPSAVAGEPIIMDWAAPMIEQGKTWAGWFRVGTTSLSSLHLPFNLVPPYTIQFKHRPMVSSLAIVSQATSPLILQMGGYFENASVSFWNLGRSLAFCIKGNTSASWTSSGVLTTYSSATWDCIEHDYAIVAESSTTFKFYMDGVYLGTGTSTEAVTAITTLNIGGTGAAATASSSAIYRNLAIYNRALSAAEVKKNANPIIEVRSTGDVSSVVIKESPVIPADACHYPLNLNGYDRFGKYAPYWSQDVVYGQDGAWVGTARTNLCSQTPYGPYVYQATTVVNPTDIPPCVPGSGIVKITADTPGTIGMSGVWTTPITPVVGDKYEHSAMIYLASGTYVTVGQHWNPWIDSSHMYIPKGRWIRCTFETTIADTSHTSILNQYGTDGIIYVCAPQYEKAFQTPYVFGTRAASHLSYNLNSSIGLDWNGNWSIVYFKKPIATYNDTFTGYCIESLGCNSNSVGGGYIWIGKVSGGDYEYLSSVGNVQAITPANYFNKEHMVSLVKSGTTVTYTVWGIAGLISSASYTLSGVASNYYVTQHGYDFKLGGWDGGNPPNAYYRDLVVAKRAFTQTELSTIYKVNMRASKQRLYAPQVYERSIV